MAEQVAVAPWRLNLLRGGDLLLVVGLGLVIWPEILDPASEWTTGRSVTVAMLGALSLLALLGLRHPLRMLPLLFWEMTWKALWLLRVALPAALGGGLDEDVIATAFECAIAVLIVAVVPWDHVWRAYVRAPGEPWRR